MARYRFGGIADYVISVGTGNAATLQPSTTVTCWNADVGGTQYTDLTDTDGTTPLASLVSDSNGAVPEFYGPDGVTEMYLDANAGSGPRRRTLATNLRDYTDDTFLPLTGGTRTGTVTSSLSSDTSVAEASIVDTGDIFDRYRRDASGRQDWGSGSAARDTNLYRDAANSLKTDDAFTVALALKHLGTTLGFYGATAAAKPTVTGSRGGNAALGSLIAALASLGLITDSTSA
ncbi:hypothetical protein [Streptomyces soliscabiei]|uniref:hypothetical protein n=1 Tax=Streptomyces soliscabiei TaxID=588897 RepID=UPI0029AA9FD9|nr:hypothetical protein [Streptomyces sp. NY05-11A]MDX2681114.1 hypothetical protein [Streptomyces sp. NY05-11A]